MANKGMKRCLMSYVVRKLKIKTTMRYHYTPITWPRSQTLTTNVDKVVEQQGLSFIADRNAKARGLFGK